MLVSVLSNTGRLLFQVSDANSDRCADTIVSLPQSQISSCWSHYIFLQFKLSSITSALTHHDTLILSDDKMHTYLQYTHGEPEQELLLVLSSAVTLLQTFF